MKYKHYAPNTECLLVYSNDINKLEDLVKENSNKDTIIIGCNELKNKFRDIEYLSYGNFNDYEEISHNIFRLLREVDKHNKKKVVIMGVKKEGLGIAIMNRLIRSASYNYIER